MPASGPDNVALVRRIYEAWWAHGTPAASGLLDPAIEFVNPPEAIEPGTHVGIDPFQRAVERIDELMEGYRVEVEEMTAAGDEVVVIGTIHARGRASGAEIRRRHGYVWTIRDGRAVRFRWFSEPAAALTAAGLEP